MPTLNIELPDKIYQRLQQEASTEETSAEKLIVEHLIAQYGDYKSLTSAKRELIQALDEDGLLGVPSHWAKSHARSIQPERRAELAKVLSKGRPLSEIIIEERGL